MSIFANNMEAMAYDHSGWAIIEESADGNTFYFGKPLVKKAEEHDAVWTIKKVVTSKTSDGRKIVKTYMAAGKYNIWEERENLTYIYI